MNCVIRFVEICVKKKRENISPLIFCVATRNSSGSRRVVSRCTYERMTCIYKNVQMQTAFAVCDAIIILTFEL